MIELGSKAKDIVSGFQGIVTAEYKFLHGCTRYAIQPPVDKDGTVPEHQVFDEPQLKVLRKPTIEMRESIDGELNKKKKPGGPMPYKPKARKI